MLILAAAMLAGAGCAQKKVPYDAQVDFENEFDIFVDLCADAMADGRRAGFEDRSAMTGYRGSTWVEVWSKRSNLDASPLSTKSKREVTQCGRKGYEIGYAEAAEDPAP